MDANASASPSYPAREAKDVVQPGEERISEEEAADRLERLWADPPGFIGWFRALQNDSVGGRIMILSFIFFLMGGVNALLMRTQLAQAESDFIGADFYNELFTMHGSTMMYLFAVPILEGFAIFLLPIMLGNREMPFPRLGVFSFFIFLMGGILFYVSFLFNAAPDAGWYAYTPLSGPEYSPGIALDFWLLALGVAEIGAIAAGIEIVIAILRMRAPGMSISRMPLLAWAFLIFAVSILFAFTPLFVGSLMLELDRKFGTHFFDPTAGGSPVLWQHIFWIFGHPEVYIQFIPATGMISMIVPVFSQRPLVGYTYVTMALVATGFISFALWVHHMFTVGLPQVAMIFFSIASILIGIPTGVQIFAWLATIWTGRPIFKTPFLFIIGFFVIFILGGITGIMVGLVPLNWQLHDSYFIVAHLHYVLLGGVTFPLFGALYYWLPKIIGKMLDERLGKWNFWLMFIGFNVTFFPMHVSGLLGMPRRIYTYPEGIGWEGYNLVSTIGAFIFALGILLFVVNYIYSARRGEDAPPNPWNADSLEWSTGSPPRNYGFSNLPVVRSRHPLWEQETVHPVDDPVARLMDALSHYPLNWRAALTTTVLDAKPVEVFRVAGPSIWPFVTSVGVMLIFGSEIFSLRIAVALGAVVTLIGLAGWHWPDRIETTEKELEFERRHNIPVYPNGSPTVTRWAMRLLLLVFAVALGTLVFTYFFLNVQNAEWPLDNIPLPDLWLPAIATLVLLAAGATVYWAQRGIRRGRQLQLRVGLLGAFLLGAGALGILFYDFTQLSFSHDTNAYGSVFFLLGGFMFLMVIGALLQNIFIQIWAWRGMYSQREHVGVSVVALFWYAVIVFWLIAGATIYLAPYLSGAGAA
jgi:cytochrome c oxidase subunit I+III